MEEFEFSAKFRHFIETNIPGVDAMKILLLCRSHPESAFTPEEIVVKLRLGIRTREAAEHLELFRNRGMLGWEGGRYRYRPDCDLAAKVEKLAFAYDRRPVTLIRMIYDARLQY